MDKHQLDLAAAETAAVADCGLDAYIGLAAAVHRSPDLANDLELSAVIDEFRRGLSILRWTAERLAEWQHDASAVVRP